MEFAGYWSEKDKEIWFKTDWKARNYEDLPLEDSQNQVNRLGYFYTMEGSFTNPITFIKYIRANPIYPPYYGPIYNLELIEFMKQNDFCYPMYDGRNEGPYKLHDRFESSEVADKLSR